MGRQDNGKRVLVACMDCANTRVVYPRAGRALPVRCSPCDLKNNRAGENNGRWRGGITRDSSKGKATRVFKEWRRSVLERDNYACVQCGAKENLHCDHIKAWSTHPELRLDVANGRVLCLECHKKTDNYLSKALKGRKFGPKKVWKTHCNRGHLYSSRDANNNPACSICIKIRNDAGGAKRKRIQKSLRGAAWWG